MKISTDAAAPRMNTTAAAISLASALKNIARQTIDAAGAVGVGAEMGVDIFLLEMFGRLQNVRTIPTREAAQISLKGAAKVFQVIHKSRLVGFGAGNFMLWF